MKTRNPSNTSISIFPSNIQSEKKASPYSKSKIKINHYFHYDNTTFCKQNYDPEATIFLCVKIFLNCLEPKFFLNWTLTVNKFRRPNRTALFHSSTRTNWILISKRKRVWNRRKRESPSPISEIPFTIDQI